MSEAPDVWGSRADLRTVIDTVPALISFFDDNHVCRFANNYHARWYGQTPSELVGLHMREFLGEKGYASRKPYLDRVAAGEEVKFDAQVPHLDGTHRDAAIRYVPRYADGRYTGFHILVFDIATHQHRFHSVFDATAAALWEIDMAPLKQKLESARIASVDDLVVHLAADHDFVRYALDQTPVVQLNEKAATLFGIKADEAFGQPFGRWCPPESLLALTANLVAYISGAPSFETETVLARSDGSKVDVLLTCAFPRNDASSSTIIVGATDISARIVKEQQLAKAQADLAHASRVATLGELLASIAHEVNQPLAAVVTNGEAALRWLNRPEADIGEAKEAIRRMIDEGTRASEIIAHTRAMTVKGGEQRTAIAPATLVEEAASLVQRQVSGLGADLRITVDAGLPEIVADKIQIQQVLINLIVNAAQAMGNQAGERRIEIRARPGKAGIVFEVEDTGPGIGESEPDKLFSTFYTTKATGMGMGLSVCKTIIEAHGGQIGVGHAAPHGAVFSFDIPLAAAREYDPANT